MKSCTPPEYADFEAERGLLAGSVLGTNPGDFVSDAMHVAYVSGLP